MAFPASSPLLSDVLADARAEARRVTAKSASLKAASLAGDVPRPDLIAYMGQLNKAVGVWNAARSTPGIAVYAQDQLGSPTLDVGAEFTAMMNATTTLRDWIFTNFPKDAGGAWLVHSYSNAGIQTALVFTTAQLAQFRNHIDTLIATIS